MLYQDPICCHLVPSQDPRCYSFACFRILHWFLLPLFFLSALIRLCQNGTWQTEGLTALTIETEREKHCGEENVGSCHLKEPPTLVCLPFIERQRQYFSPQCWSSRQGFDLQGMHGRRSMSGTLMDIATCTISLRDYDLHQVQLVNCTSEDSGQPYSTICSQRRQADSLYFA